MKVPFKRTKTKTTKADSDEFVIDFEEQIRCRAYEIYERRGGQDGHDIEDWLQAEAELASGRAKPLAAAAVKAARKAPATSTGKAKAKQVKKSRSPVQSKTVSE